MDIPSEHSLIEAKTYINSIDFSMIINKMVKHQGWLKEDALTVCEMYRRFLYLNKKYHNQKLSPSEDIDEFWHNHILDTKKYHQDCAIIFGRYLDHYPYFGIDNESSFNDLEGSFQNTQALYFQEFGGFVYEARTIGSKLIAFIKNRFKAKPKRAVLKVNLAMR